MSWVIVLTSEGDVIVTPGKLKVDRVVVASAQQAVHRLTVDTKVSDHVEVVVDAVVDWPTHPPSRAERV